MTRWYEDIKTGEPFPLGAHTFTKAEIIRFAKAYDPQYLHTDPEAARAGPYGGLVASGWHTVCAGHRKMVDALFAEEERLRAQGREPGVSGPSPGVNEMVFKAPVRPGDTVTFTLVVHSKRHSASIPGWGLLFNHLEAVNQHGEMVYRADLAGFSKLRDFKPSLKQRLMLWVAGAPVLKKLLGR